MIIIHILEIVAIVFVILFLLSLFVYFFNLDMKLAAFATPHLAKIYDHGKKKRAKAAAKSEEK